MTELEKRNIYVGLLGTLAFHLLLLFIFLTAKIGKVKSLHQESIQIEFSEQEFKTIEQILEANKLKNEKIENLPDKTLSNIASNVAEKMNEQISTEKYIEEVMDELGMEEINPDIDNTLPDDPALNSRKKNKSDIDDVANNAGITRITYNVPGRTGRYIERPIYRCQGGGKVIVKIHVDPSGSVSQAEISSASTSDDCVLQMALESSKNSRFSSDATATKKVKGTITYIFVAQ